MTIHRQGLVRERGRDHRLDAAIAISLDESWAGESAGDPDGSVLLTPGCLPRRLVVSAQRFPSMWNSQAIPPSVAIGVRQPARLWTPLARLSGRRSRRFAAAYRRFAHQDGGS
jgi:hypothetical protein